MCDYGHGVAREHVHEGERKHGSDSDCDCVCKRALM